MNIKQKECAIKCLEKLDIYKPYIRKFKSAASTPCFFENFGGFYVDQEPELYNKIKEIETEYDCLVYAVTHEFVESNECWSMLCITRGETLELEDFLMEATGNCFYAFAYVWNKSVDWLSEFGDIYIKSFGGGIKRLT